jgi:hypothetical protein
VAKHAYKLPGVGTAVDILNMGMTGGRTAVTAAQAGRSILRTGVRTAGWALTGVFAGIDTYAYHQQQRALEEAMGTPQGAQLIQSLLQKQGGPVGGAVPQDVAKFYGDFGRPAPGGAPQLRRATVSDYAKVFAYSALLSPFEVFGGENFRRGAYNMFNIAKPGDIEGLEEFDIEGLGKFYAFGSDPEKVRAAVEKAKGVASSSFMMINDPSTGYKTRVPHFYRRPAQKGVNAPTLESVTSDVRYAGAFMGVSITQPGELAILDGVAVTPDQQRVLRSFSNTVVAANTGTFVPRVEKLMRDNPWVAHELPSLMSVENWGPAEYSKFRRIEVMSGASLRLPSEYGTGSTRRKELQTTVSGIWGKEAGEIGPDDLISAQGGLRQATAKALLFSLGDVTSNPQTAARGYRGKAAAELFESQLASVIGADIKEDKKQEFRAVLSDLGDELARARGGKADPKRLAELYSQAGRYIDPEILAAEKERMGRWDLSGSSKFLEGTTVGRLAITGKLMESYTWEDRMFGRSEEIRAGFEQRGLVGMTRDLLPRGSSRKALLRYLKKYPGALGAGFEGEDEQRALSEGLRSAITSASTAEREQMAKVLRSDPVLYSQFGRFAEDLNSIAKATERRMTPRKAVETVEQIAGIDLWGGLAGWQRKTIQEGKTSWTVQARMARKMLDIYEFEGGSYEEKASKAYQISAMFIKAMHAKTGDEQFKLLAEAKASLEKATRKPSGTETSGEQTTAADWAKLSAVLERSSDVSDSLLKKFGSGDSLSVTLDPKSLESLAGAISKAAAENKEPSFFDLFKTRTPSGTPAEAETP